MGSLHNGYSLVQVVTPELYVGYYADSVTYHLTGRNLFRLQDIVYSALALFISLENAALSGREPAVLSHRGALLIVGPFYTFLNRETFYI